MTETVRVSVPARAEHVHLLRTVTGAVAAHLALSLDDVDDLRLAVDEACARLLALPGEPRTLRLDLRPMRGRIEVVLGVDATATWPPGVSRTRSRGGCSGLSAITSGSSLERIPGDPDREAHLRERGVTARARPDLETVDERDLFERRPDEGAREELARRFLPLAEYLARRFAGRGSRRTT